MIIGRYEGDLQPLIKWAVNRDSKQMEKIPPQPFRTWIRELMPEGASQIEYWVGVITPRSKLNGDWVDGYPHTHVNSVNWPPNTPTIVTYLVTPEKGGEFGVGGESPDDPYEFIQPEPGLAVYTDAKTWHGVKPVKRGTRIALIATAWL